MSDELEPGDVRRISSGPFAGFSAKIVEDRGTQVACEITLFGRTTTVQIARELLVSDELTPERIAEMEAEVMQAARARAPHAYRRTLWLARHVRDGVRDEDLARLDAELAQLMAEIDEANRPFEAEALARFRAAFAEVKPEDRLGWWSTWWSEHRSSSRSAENRAQFARELLGRDIVEDKERWQAIEAAMAPIDALAERIARARHLAFANDLEGTAPVASNAALEAAIEATPDDPDVWMVYGDWLQAQGDPRGELVIVQDGSPRGRQLGSRLFDRHERYYLGGLARYPEIITHEWRRGFLRSAKVMPTRAEKEANIQQAALIATLLALPSSRFLEDLTIACASCHETGVTDAIIAALVAGGPRPTLRRLAFATNKEEEMLSWTETGALGALWPLYPRLVTVDLCAGTLELGALSLPALARLRIETCGLTPENVGELVRAQVPALRSLELWFGDARAATNAQLGDVVALLAAPAVAGVTELGIVNATFTDELCTVLAESPILARLESLDLSRGTLTDDGVRTLCDARTTGRAPRLRRIDVRACYVSDDGLAALRASKLAVIGDEQREAELYDGAYHRYCAVWE